MSGTSTENDGQGMIVNPKPTAENQDWDGDDADRADRLRFEEEQAMIREQSEARRRQGCRRGEKGAHEAKKAAALSRGARRRRLAASVPSLTRTSRDPGATWTVTFVASPDGSPSSWVGMGSGQRMVILPER